MVEGAVVPVAHLLVELVAVEHAGERVLEALLLERLLERDAVRDVEDDLLDDVAALVPAHELVVR